ncbi:terpene synthase family protein [Methylohalobius crimeensis]|uniref:terpene synthase family protein n=1 Tax=Methylohalobius crimeensis TaxID=244365 RepID=UPI0003B529BE|nr:terpene synthase [Methylohalobius crimeensis]
MTSQLIYVPEFYCPFPERVNPYADIAHQHTLDWVRRFELVVDDDAFRRLAASRFGWLAARAYPTAAEEELKLVSDWNTWLFIRDDQCDETGVGKDPAKLTFLHERFLNILMGCPCSTEDGGLDKALQDLWSRMRARGSLSWQARFIHSVEEYFESSVWEAKNRSREVYPDVATYTKMRPYTGGLYTDIELIEIIERISLPLEIRKHTAIEQLALMANNVVCWSNDVLSLQKELEQEDIHNLVIALSYEHELDLQEAVVRATEMCNEEVRKFIALEERLPLFPTRHAQGVRRYVEILRSWMRGNLDWGYESARYRTDGIQTNHLPHSRSRGQVTKAGI